MKYEKTIPLKNGTTLQLRNGTAEDGAAMLDIFMQTHMETDYLLSYLEESSHTVAEEAEYLQKKTDSENEIEILAFIDGILAGIAGIDAVGAKYKVKHRAEFGISILKEYWGFGIGRALINACVQCAKEAGYVQLELDVVADNTRAIALYQSVGFQEYGRNPKGFRSKTAGFQELVYMRLEL